MELQRAIPAAPAQSVAWELTRVASFVGMRVLAWADEVLYASRGYTLLRAQPNAAGASWEVVARFHPAWWRTLSSSARITYRICRDGFQALAALASGHLLAAVPGAIVRLVPGDTEFRVSHKILRGTRPLHITATPDGQVFWGEYFDNPDRDEVHIYASNDHGATWYVAYTFPKCAIRHVHNIVYDEWEECLWILTGDNGSECRILRASCDFRRVDDVIFGNQQARAVALIPARDALYFSSDTPFESNHIYRLDRRGLDVHGHARGSLIQLANLNSSSIYGCRVGEAMFFSTMVEPSGINPEHHVCLYGSFDGLDWRRALEWKKDRWPMRFFQYGNAFLPDGRNTTDLLAVNTIAVKDGGLETTLWRVTTDSDPREPD